MPATPTVSVQTQDGLTFTFEANDFTVHEKGHVSVIQRNNVVAVIAADQWVTVYFTASEVVS